MSDVSPKYLAGFLAAAGAVHGNNGATRPTPPVILSPEERIKKELHPLDAFPRLLDCAHADRPPGADDQFRFRWFGLFYQQPRQDAFLLRLRLPGGRLRAHQLLGLAAITQELADGSVMCNPQGGLDLPGIPVRAAAEVLRRVEEIGLRSLLTGGDCVQAVRGGELTGFAEDPGPSAIYPLVCALEQALALDRQLADLPASCEVVLRTADERPAPPTGEPSPHGTIIFQETRAGGGEPGFSLLLPGTDATGIILGAAQVVPACLRLLRRWAEGGGHSDRAQGGLVKFYAGIGREHVREWLGPGAGSSPDTRQPPAVVPVPFAGVRVPDGRLLSENLTRLARAAADSGPSEVRLASGHLYLPHPPSHRAAEAALRDALDSA